MASKGQPTAVMMKYFSTVAKHSLDNGWWAYNHSYRGIKLFINCFPQCNWIGFRGIVSKFKYMSSPWATLEGVGVGSFVRNLLRQPARFSFLLWRSNIAHLSQMFYNDWMLSHHLTMIICRLALHFKFQILCIWIFQILNKIQIIHM